MEDTEEAESEITFADDDSKCDLVLGECFFETEKVKAEEMLQTKIENETKSIEEKQGGIDERRASDGTIERTLIREVWLEH